jgi:glycosyltransferase involved in cell wall biosynthesis
MNNSKPLRVAMLSTIAWRTPPLQYGPWEKIVSSITEGLVARGIDVTLFATQDAITKAKLEAVAPHGYREDPTMVERVWDLLHISHLFEQAEQFDIIHNNFDFPPLAFSQLVQTPMVTTIHGFSSPAIIPVYEKYNKKTHYVSISNANRHSTLDYAATVYHGIDIAPYTFRADDEGYLLFFGRIHNDKGVKEAIQVAQETGRKLIIAGLIADDEYFKKEIQPHIDDNQIRYVGNVNLEEGNKLLGGASALMHLINFDEPFGLSVVEAMACGTPVIAISRGSLPELLVDGKTGFLVHSVEEAVAAVGRLSEIVRQDCRTHVEQHFTIDQMVEGYLAVYQQILGQK